VIGGGPRNDNKNSDSSDDDDGDEPPPMTDQERKTLRRKIREMMDRMPEMQELTDPKEKKAKMRELLTKYELVVEEEDPEWPDDAEDGMGFGLGQFFDKITIKAEKRDDADDDDDAGDGTKKEVVWEDDNYIKPVRDVKTKEWDDTVFTDFGPLIVLVHNRYKRYAFFFPNSNYKPRVVHIWFCQFLQDTTAGYRLTVDVSSTLLAKQKLIRVHVQSYLDNHYRILNNLCLQTTGE
jgi:hypothetical protein